MIGTIIIALLVLLLTIFIYLSYKNEKQYKEEQEAKKEARKRQRPIIRKVEKRASSTPPLSQEQTKPDIIPEEKTKTTPIAKPIEVVKKEVIPQPIEEKKEEKKEEKASVSLPEYPAFDHSRLLEMGLSDDEAKEFVAELIPQITVQIPLIEASYKEEDFHAMERLTHSIKGSSTTVGTGGVSAVLVDFNTYLKHGTELPLIQAYIEQLKHYTEALQKQYA